MIQNQYAKVNCISVPETKNNLKRHLMNLSNKNCIYHEIKITKTIENIKLYSKIFKKQLNKWKNIYIHGYEEIVSDRCQFSSNWLIISFSFNQNASRFSVTGKADFKMYLKEKGPRSPRNFWERIRRIWLIIYKDLL